MQEQAYEQKLQLMIRSSNWFMQALQTIRNCELPDWFVGGGVIRSLVWDHLHGYPVSTSLADIDVVFFDPNNLSSDRDAHVQRRLRARLPNLPWEVTNQAAVHIWYEAVFGYAVPPLLSTEDGIGTWPETATCIGVRLLADDSLYIAAPFGLNDLFKMILRRNPRRVTLEVFRQRVQSKRIRHKWPHVRIIDE